MADADNIHERLWHLAKVKDTVIFRNIFEENLGSVDLNYCLKQNISIFWLLVNNIRDGDMQLHMPNIVLLRDIVKEYPAEKLASLDLNLAPYDRESEAIIALLLRYIKDGVVIYCASDQGAFALIREYPNFINPLARIIPTVDFTIKYNATKNIAKVWYELSKQGFFKDIPLSEGQRILIRSISVAEKMEDSSTDLTWGLKVAYARFMGKVTPAKCSFSYRNSTGKLTLERDLSQGLIPR